MNADGLSSSPKAAAAEPPCFCRQCGYDLRGLAAARCPECGRAFDLSNPRSYRRRPLRRWLRHIKRAAFLLLALVVLLPAIWGWLFWGWHAEQQALADLKARPWSTDYEPIGPPWLAQHLGRTNFVLNRVNAYRQSSGPAITSLEPFAQLPHLKRLELEICEVTDLSPLKGLTALQGIELSRAHVADLSPLSRLKNLEELSLDDAPITDLTPLASLTKLRRLYVRHTLVKSLAPLERLSQLDVLCVPDSPVTDLASLPRLPTLRTLNVAGDPIRDFSSLSTNYQLTDLILMGTKLVDLTPLAGLKDLKMLRIDDTQVTDLRPLAGFTKLEQITLERTPARDFSPLAGIKSLQFLWLTASAITPAQLEALHRALPRTLIQLDEPHGIRYVGP